MLFVKQLQKRISVRDRSISARMAKHQRLLGALAIVLMSWAILFLGAVLPLRSLYFYQAFPLTRFENWLLWPARVLFPGKPIISSQHLTDKTALTFLHFSWKGTLLLATCFFL